MIEQTYAVVEYRASDISGKTIGTRHLMGAGLSLNVAKDLLNDIIGYDRFKVGATEKRENGMAAHWYANDGELLTRIEVISDRQIGKVVVI